MHQQAANDLRGTDVCAKELQVTRAALVRYRGAMAGVVRSVGVSGTTVEDVVHDAFETACRKAAAERPDPADEARFLAWLCTLARYAALTTRNDNARSREVSSPTEELEDVPEPNRAYIGHYDDKVAAAVVFAKLNPDDRALLHQHFYEDKTVQELAEERGVPWTTMRSRLDGVIHRARSIVSDKAGRRRGLGATILVWLAFTISEAQLWWSRSKRVATAGALGFLTGGALIGALLGPEHLAAVSAYESFSAATGNEQTGASAAVLTGQKSPTFSASVAAVLPAGFAPCAMPAEAAVSPAKARDTHAKGSAANAAPKVQVEDRSRVILPWGVAAAVRDHDQKGKK